MLTPGRVYVANHNISLRPLQTFPDCLCIPGHAQFEKVYEQAEDIAS
jgi:hypothetical protein